MKKPELSLYNKVALITGAAGGIGEAIVNLFGAAGARLFINGTQEEKLKALSDRLTVKGVEHSYKAIDITAPGAPQSLVDAVIDKMGTLDILVNCAGINRPERSEDVTEKNWDDIYNINVRALFFVSQAAGRLMIEKRQGKIINMSSQAGGVALPLRAAYCSSKGAVDQITRTLAYEWAEYNVQVNAVAPTFVETPLTRGMLEDEAFRSFVIGSIPAGRMATPEEVAYATLFLATDVANIITGHILLVDGGWTIK
ncbi:MAG: glucose 1-dehydrogenase [Deltaproteobacteria bacterium]|nr:glucose 1-dehydrogenase [Deltaproteobacteria bacterium]MBW2596449.1 glucose 1-dehydrogenase [Deltaproteobacteria bacterium]MBW2650054.1 glucose 1-dehydrogenase [Deltaproteobacteria bacterium]